MEKVTNTKQPTPQEFIDSWSKSGMYNYLQIILSKNDKSILGQHYLVVSNRGFAVYKLIDVNYAHGEIQMTLINTETGNRANVSLDINCKHPKFYLVSWNDIVSMVRKYSVCKSSYDELLEFL